MSGGIGAELSGGNFWQGAVTGGIVAGLNHTLHRANTRQQIKNRLRDEFNGTGMNPDDKATFSDHESLTEKLPTLKNIKDKILYDVVEDNSLRGKGIVLETEPTKIRVNLNKAKNLLDYAYTLGHEMIHVFDFIYNRKIVFSLFGANKIGREAMKYISEYRAYQWE